MQLSPLILALLLGGCAPSAIGIWETQSFQATEDPTGCMAETYAHGAPEDFTLWEFREEEGDLAFFQLGSTREVRVCACVQEGDLVTCEPTVFEETYEDTWFSFTAEYLLQLQDRDHGILEYIRLDECEGSLCGYATLCSGTLEHDLLRVE